MPVEFCRCCHSVRPLQVATSRVRVLLPDGDTSDIVTRTYYCSSCRSLLLGQDENGKQAAGRRACSLLQAIVSPGRRRAKSIGTQRGRT